MLDGINKSVIFTIWKTVVGITLTFFRKNYSHMALIISIYNMRQLAQDSPKVRKKVMENKDFCIITYIVTFIPSPAQLVKVYESYFPHCLSCFVLK